MKHRKVLNLLDEESDPKFMAKTKILSMIN